IDAENKGGAWIPLDAVGRGVCGAVNVAPDVLAAEWDGDDVGESAELRARARLRARMEGVTPVLWASGRPGHFHLAALVSDDERRERLGRALEEIGLERKTSARPPLSAHRWGLEVALLHPATPAEA